MGGGEGGVSRGRRFRRCSTFVGDPANEDKVAVAITAVGIAVVGVDLQPHARVAERRVGETGAGAVAGDARFLDAECFGSSEERRVGKEWVGTCRSRWSPYR